MSRGVLDQGGCDDLAQPKTSGAALAGAYAIGFPNIARGQADKIKIGHLTPLTGFLGALGAYATLGMRMAEEEINKAGGVMGRQIEVMSEDSVNPATAATKAQRMLVRAGIQQPDMVAVLGIRLQPYMTAIVVLGVAMAAMGGAFFAPITIVHPAMGAEIITVAFVVVVIGGLGTCPS